MPTPSPRPEDLLRPTGRGLWCAPGGFYVDPSRPVDRAVITHGHGDHARPGHGAVLATPGTAAAMRVRYGDGCAGRLQALPEGEALRQGEVTVTLAPAGHILGSAQAVLEWAGLRVVVSGDYKRRPDPTCLPFEPVRCDLFVTEATFALPVFRHPEDGGEIRKLLDSLALFPERCHLVGVYALGKCQRIIRLLRAAGYARPLWVHEALAPLCAMYEARGVALGPLRPLAAADAKALAGEIVLCPPGAAGAAWARALPDPVIAAASGWLGVRRLARQRGCELPLVISDHADWDELVRTLDDVNAPRVWVTHGREDALVHHARGRGIDAAPLAAAAGGDA